MAFTTSSRTKKCFVFIGALLSTALVICGSWGIYYKDTIAANIKDKTPYPFYNGDEHLIAHAGGAIDGHVYTNSREAVEQSIRAGMKFIEIDFIKTSDGHYIAGHDWKLVNNATKNLTGGNPLSLNDFMNAKLHGKYTPMDEKDVVELMEKHPDWILVIDKARDIKHLAKTFPFKDRIILQVYALKNYVKALDYGFKYPVLRLKGGRRGIKEIYKWAMDVLNIKGVILGEKSFEKNLDYIKELHDNGVMVILYGNPRFKIVENAAEVRKYAGTHLDLVDTDKLQKL